MARKTKRNKPSEPNGKESSPRRGEKTKQSKVSQGKEMEPKGARQTKLDFATTGTPENTKEKPRNASNEQETWTTVQKNKLTFATDVIGTPKNTKTMKAEGIEDKTGTPTNAKDLTTETRTTAITPDANTGAKRLAHPTPPTTPERTTNESQNNNNNNKKENKESNDNDNDNNKKPEATTKKKTKYIKTNTEEASTNGTYNTPNKYRTIRYNRDTPKRKTF
jgi:hypothetical protein